MFSLFIGICFCSLITTRAAVVKKNPTDLPDADSVRFPHSVNLWYFVNLSLHACKLSLSPWHVPGITHVCSAY